MFDSINKVVTLKNQILFLLQGLLIFVIVFVFLIVVGCLYAKVQPEVHIQCLLRSLLNLYLGMCSYFLILSHRQLFLNILVFNLAPESRKVKSEGEKKGFGCFKSPRSHTSQTGRGL